MGTTFYRPSSFWIWILFKFSLRSLGDKSIFFSFGTEFRFTNHQHIIPIGAKILFFFAVHRFTVHSIILEKRNCSFDKKNSMNLCICWKKIAIRNCIVLNDTQNAMFQTRTYRYTIHA